MLDINDDAGIAVRQIGLDAFDQTQALFTFSRIKGYEPQRTPSDAETPLEASRPAVPTVEVSLSDDDLW